jgi:hypothetical protein
MIGASLKGLNYIALLKKLNLKGRRLRDRSLRFEYTGYYLRSGVGED